MFDDREILEGCKNNNRKAQELLYNKYASLLLGVLCRYSKNRAEAEDILQEAYVKIFRHIDQFRGESSLYAWMKRIVINTALRHIQSNVHYNTNVPLNDNIEYREKVDMISEISADEIIKVLQKLPQGFRTVFNLYAVEGYKHKEIAKMLNISENTSKSQYSRAKKFLQKVFLKNTDITDFVYMLIF